jgi:hypothetical protein
MADATTSRQKAEYISHDLITRGKSEYVQLKYKRLDGDRPGAEMTTGAFVAKLDKESKDRIKAGGTFVVVKTKEGEFWNLTKVDDVSTYVEKAPNTYKGDYNKGGSTYKKSDSYTYNTAGVKVGAVLHDAVALAGTGAKTATVKTIAEELLSLSYELEANVNAGKYEAKATTTTAKTSASSVKTNVAEKLTVEEDSLDNIDF